MVIRYEFCNNYIVVHWDSNTGWIKWFSNRFWVLTDLLKVHSGLEAGFSFDIFVSVTNLKVYKGHKQVIILTWNIVLKSNLWQLYGSDLLRFKLQQERKTMLTYSYIAHLGSGLVVVIYLV